MKAPMIAAGSWLLLPEALIRDRVGPDSQRFSHKAGRRPVVAAGDSVMGLVGFSAHHRISAQRRGSVSP